MVHCSQRTSVLVVGDLSHIFLKEKGKIMLSDKYLEHFYLSLSPQTFIAFLWYLAVIQLL